MTPSKKILVIDDNEDVCELICDTAKAMGIDCVATTKAPEFLDALTDDVTLILLDLIMPEVDGIELLRLIAQRGSKAGIVLISGSGKRIIETAEELIATVGLSSAGHLMKPFRIAELKSILETLAVPASRPAFQRAPDMAIPEQDLRRAIDRQEFVLHYQPQIDAVSGDVIGLEALVRWQHPDRGLIFPDSFIPRLEEMGLIDAMGWIVVDRGMREIGEFAGPDGTPPMLSLNISPVSLNDLKFPDRFLAIADQHRVPASGLIIEITESGLIKGFAQTLDVLTRLRLKGIQLSIDDFGTGFAMMQQLRNVPATELKIDKSFVQQMHLHDRDRVMVQKTVEIGHELGLRVVGEGVETEEQFDFLVANQCDALQGYLFSRPLAVNALIPWLESYRERLQAAG